MDMNMFISQIIKDSLAEFPKIENGVLKISLMKQSLSKWKKVPINH